MIPKIKIEYLFEDLFNGVDGLFHYLVECDSNQTESLLDEFINSNNERSLDVDYLMNHSAEKYLSPLMIKYIKYICDYENLSFEDFINGTMSSADKSNLILYLFDYAGGDTYITEILYNRFAFKWKKLWDAITTSYKPLENYSMEEVRTPDVTKTTNGKGTTKTDSTTGVFGFNSTESNPSGNIDGEQTDEVINRTESETGTETINRSGNIGVTTSQQMLESEFEVRKHDFYKMIYDDIDSILCLSIY